jgi:aspartate-semialdehyde dehydrogenase
MSEVPGGATTAPIRSPRRLVVFGVTGQLGQELIDRLDESDWPIAELIGVASPKSVGETFDFRGDELDVAGEWPSLKGWDLVFICTRGIAALEVVRECLRAEVPCVDLTGALSAQSEVPLPTSVAPVGSEGDALASAPLIGLPSATTLAWATVLEAVGGVTRVVGTVLSSASAQGRRGLVALSEESIALFNQSESAEPGPAGQTVAFDVVPGGGVEPDRIRSELNRVFGEALRIDVAGVQVPTFVGEGTSLTIELEGPLDRAEIESRLGARKGVEVVSDGPGSRGLAAVEEGVVDPVGPTLRDAGGTDEVLVGRIEADTSVAAGLGWRLWLASDPVRLVAGHALHVAGRRLGLE